MWLSVEKSDETEGHLLKEDDTIKLGRVIFKIKQVQDLPISFVDFAQIKCPETAAQAPEETLLKSLKQYMVSVLSKYS